MIGLSKCGGVRDHENYRSADLLLASEKTRPLMVGIKSNILSVGSWYGLRDVVVRSLRSSGMLEQTAASVLGVWDSSLC